MLLSPEHLPEALKRVQDGVLVRMPVAEFDALVDSAARAGARKAAPRLLEARYHATLKEDSLIGEGQWKLVHTEPEPGLLSLEPFNLAIRQARFENGEALIGAFSGKDPALLVNTPGERTVSLDWSVRGESRPEGLQFHLEMPSCPVALLEVDVPVGRSVLLLDDNALLSGPHDAETADLRRWTIVCGGRQRADRQRVDFRILAADRLNAADHPNPFVRQKTTQKLHPDGLDAVFELTVEGLSSGIRELVCDCDPELRLRDVIGPGVAGCTFQTGDAHKPSRLTIRLREPIRTGTWQVLCLAPLNYAPSPGDPRRIAWRSPGLRLVDGVPRCETLTVWLDSDLRVENWDPGSFRIDSSALDRSTGAQVLTLSGGGLSPLRRPSARLQSYGVEFSAHQLTWWRCDAAGIALTLQIGWDVRQGQLFQLPVLLPAGWSVEKVEMAPPSLLRDWYVRKSGGKETLFVDLASPLGARSRNERELSSETLPRPDASPRARLPMATVHMRPSLPGLQTGKALDFPDTVPLGARYRQGALALDCDPQLFHLDVRTSAERAEPETEGPWGQQLPEYYYRFRGQSITGTLQVHPRPSRLRARCDSEILVGSGEAVIETHLFVEAEVGSPNTIDLLLSAGAGAPWQWRNETSSRGEDATVNRVRRVERVSSSEASDLLHLLASTDPLQAAVVWAARPAGERWRLTLTRPLTSREPLRLQARQRLQPRDNRWQVPLPTILGADRMEGEVTLHLAGTDLVHVNSIGLREVGSSAEKGAGPLRTFRYGQNEIHLTLSGQALAPERSNRVSIDRASLVTSVGENGVLRDHLSFQVANWSANSLPLRLPPGSQPWAIQVDGRWLPRQIPALAAVPSQEATGSEKKEPVELELPVPARVDALPGDNLHRFEIVYTRTMPARTFWQALDAAIPRLPVAPITFHHTWRLHPKLTPLFPGRYQAVPGTVRRNELASLPRHADELFHLPGSLARLDPLQEEKQAGSRVALERAVQELCLRHADQTMSLREIVSETAFSSLKDRYFLLIDTLALQEKGVGAETLITIKRTAADEAIPPWSECGLIAIPAHRTILLTATTGRGAGLREPLSEEVEHALEEAARYGQDASGRFRSALSWLHPENIAVPAGAAQPRPFEFDDEGIDWSEWEPVAGMADQQFIVLRRDVVTALGLSFGLLVGLCLWMSRWRSARFRVTLILLFLALFGLGALWLPSGLRDLVWWPLLVAGGAAVLVYLRALIRNSKESASLSNEPKNSASAAVATGMLLLGLLGWNGRAAAPAPFAVYLVPGPADAPEKQTVLVPADLLDRLKALARQAPLAPGGPQVVLLDAAYEGQLVDGGKLAEFTVVYSAHSLSEEPGTVIVPLSGVQLTGEVLLDGARVAPLALPAPQSGYFLPVRGRGRHKIELRFRAPILGTEEDRNVMFTAPPLVRNSLSWRIPEGALATQVLVKNGAQWTSRNASDQRLEADLGAVPLPVHLHWYQPRHPTRVTFQAAYLWDLGVDSSHLTTWLRYRVEQGAIKTLEMDLPAELEISSANAQRTIPATRPSWLARFHLRDWYVTRAGNKRTLHLELPYPISGDFQVTLELLPRTPLTSPASLPLPSPRGASAGGPHYLAYRTQPGLSAQRDTSQNLTRVGNKEFAPDWLGEPRLEATFQGAAYRIAANQQPQLLLRLAPIPPVVQGDVDITLQVGAQRAEMEVDAEVQAPNKDLAAVEWELPPHCTLTAVTGEPVRAWKQHDSRVLVWLNRTTTRARIRLSGWLTLEQRDGRSHLDLRGPRLAHAAKQHTQIHLVASREVALAGLRTRNLQPVSPDAGYGKSPRRSGEPDRTFETWDLSFRLECEAQSAANAVARVMTLAEVADHELRFTTKVDYNVRQGELRHVRLRLRNWEEEKVEVQAEHVALWPGPRRVMGERSWLLPLQPGVHGHYQVTLRGSMPLDKAAIGVPMPEVLVQDVERADYFVAVAGSELTGEAKGSLESGQTIQQTLRSIWPSAAQRVEQSGGQTWRIAGSEWQMRLLPKARTLEPTPIRVYLLEHSAAVVDGKRWLHEARCWLSHEAHADLNLVFPTPVRVLSASVDTALVTPLQAGSARVWIPLPGRPGVRFVRLRWFNDPPEPLDRPKLIPPQLADAVKGPILGTVIVPAGWQIAGNPPPGLWSAGPTREAALALWHAEAQWRISQDLVKQRREREVVTSLAAAQRSFNLYCRHARHALDLGADQNAVAGPQGQNLAGWLEDMQARNRSLKIPDRNAQTETSSSASTLGLRILDSDTGGGMPISWQALPNAEPLKLTLISHKSQEFRHSLIATGQWLGCLVVVWLLAFLPILPVRLRLLWPEQIALLGLLGWHLSGLTSIVVALLLIAGCGRIVLLIRGLRTLLRQQRRQPSTMSMNNEPEA
jgi:hypothetical protein